jgi:hypothetical protein
MNSEELAASHKRMESEIFPQSSPVTAPAVAIEKASFCPWPSNSCNFSSTNKSVPVSVNLFLV